MNSISPARAAFIYSPEFEKYPYPPDCPFRPERTRLTRKALFSMGLLTGPDRAVQAPQPAPPVLLEKFHTPRYLDILRQAGHGHLDTEGLFAGLGTPDTPVFPGLYDYAALACGATLLGAELLRSGEARIAFNPSGGFHHAFPERAAGFCYINDIVIGCMVLAERLKRVLFLDLDLHHCDGVQHAFYHRSDVMTISLHESGKTLFPGTGFADEIGSGEGLGYSVNVPLPVGAYDVAWLRAFREVVLPLIDAYDPEVIVLELGMDALAGDPLGHLSLTNNAYAEAVKLIVRFDKPLLVTGGGGYHVDNTVRGWALAWSVLCGDDSIDAHLGLGGVMLETTDWSGGLRDRVLIPTAEQRATVEPAVDAAIGAIKKTVFPIHGLSENL